MKHKLPKGVTLSYTCEAVDFDGKIIEVEDTKHELLDLMKERGFERYDYEIQWVVNDMDINGVILNNEGVGETKEEAVRDFWSNYKA